MSSLSKEYSRPFSREAVSLETQAEGRVTVVSRAHLADFPVWEHAFSHLRKDRRYYEIVEDTICPAFEYKYFVIWDGKGKPRAVQPFFILDQDLLTGASPKVKSLIARARRFWPRFLIMKTLMVGCAAGEGHLPAADWSAQRRDAGILARELANLARQLKAPLIVLKEFPSEYRAVLSCFMRRGFARVPSMPMTRLDIDYENFDDYMAKALKSKTRSELRKKFKIAEKGDPIHMEVVSDPATVIEEIYALYLNVFERSKLQFEKLTKNYFLELGRKVPDKTRVFIWRQNSRIIAFSLCLVEGDKLYGEYIGFDYDVALKVHLYFYVMRDMISWAIDNGFKTIISSGLSYGPKLHLRHVLKPLDLYVRHASPVVNAILKRALPWLEPTRGDENLRKFSNYDDLWGKQT